MNIKSLFITLAMLFFLSLINNLNAKTIKGIVIDLSTKRPIENGLVVILHKDKVIASQVIDSTGIFVFTNLNIDRFTLHVTGAGYMEILKGPFLISRLDTFKVVVGMQSVNSVDESNMAPDRSEELGSSRATEDRTIEYLREKGFFQRKASGWGKFLSPDDLKGNSYGNMSILLRRIPGLVFQYGPYGTEAYPLRSINSSAGDPPKLQFFLDGLSLDENINIDNINPNDVAGVEFYSSNIDAPARYHNPWKKGGVLLIWTKR